MDKRSIRVEDRDWPVSPLPGPIALVTTVDVNGNVNVAPKSWISFVTGEPPRLVLGCHRQHHTARNLLATGECVLNFPGDDQVLATWDAHLYKEPGPDEVAARGFTPLPAERVAPPRLSECRSHIEARLESARWYGDECLLVLDVVAASFDAEAMQGADPYAWLRPIFYLAPSTYGVIERSHQVRPADESFTRYVILLEKNPGCELTPELIRAHVAHLKRLEERGQLVLCGPFGDYPGGMVIIQAESLEEARAIAEADPFVASGMERYEVRTWHLSNRENNHMGFGD